MNVFSPSNKSDSEKVDKQTCLPPLCPFYSTRLADNHREEIYRIFSANNNKLSINPKMDFGRPKVQPEDTRSLTNMFMWCVYVYL